MIKNIYKMLGEKKINIIKQILGELFIAGTLAICGSILISKNMQSVIENELKVYLENQESKDEDREDYYLSGQYIVNPNKLTNQTLINNFHVQVDHNAFIYVGIVVLISCGFGGIIAPMVFLDEKVKK